MIDHVTHTDNKMWLAVDIPVAQAEKMLKTKYFEHWNPKGRFEASSDEYTIPAELTQHIDLVKPGVIASDVTGRTRRSREPVEQGPSFVMILSVLPVGSRISEL